LAPFLFHVCKNLSTLRSLLADIQDTLRRVTCRLAEEGPGGVLVVCGTGYIMPQARAFLGIDEPRCVSDSDMSACVFLFLFLFCLLCCDVVLVG